MVKFSTQKAVSFDIRLAKYAGFMLSDLSTLATRMVTGIEKMMQLQLVVTKTALAGVCLSRI